MPARTPLSIATELGMKEFQPSLLARLLGMVNSSDAVSPDMNDPRMAPGAPYQQDSYPDQMPLSSKRGEPVSELARILMSKDLNDPAMTAILRQHPELRRNIPAPEYP
ncbi:MAG: hypothetical protein F4X97_15560 [Boseongicola sp. SB0662_bin_57]|nr:hypothetical protein [Boseongicola sp.]MYA89841.1 hypothetical protein [Boseongicola sp. SB0662_bin_57]